LNLRSISLIFVFSLPFLGACGGGPEERRKEINEQQLKVLLEIQRTEAAIRGRILTHAIVREAKVHFRPGGVLAEITLKSSGEPGGAGREDLPRLLRKLGDDVNRYIKELTGVGKENVSLRVTPSD
jgi:hypothetical protein